LKKKQIPDMKKIKVPCGKILSIQFRKQFRGLITKASKKDEGQTKKSKHFLNQITCIISLGDINLNVFIFKSSFKISGCKNMNIAQEVIRALWEVIEPLEDVYTFLDDKYPNFVFESVMSNIDFLLGFNVDRKCLNTLLNNPKYEDVIIQSRYEPTTDTNVKIQLKANEPQNYKYFQLIRFPSNIKYKPSTSASVPLRFAHICTQTCLNMDTPKHLHTSTQVWISGETENPGQKSNKKNRKKTTFMVFRSSKTIMSSRYKDNMEKDFNYFINIIGQYKNSIEERKDEPQQNFIL